jgi:hypothetical protein
MIFAASTDDSTLMVFASEVEAVAYCEGLDVEAGGWLFWDNAGSPLQAEFLVPNTRGRFIVGNGKYRLVATATPHHAALAETLSEIKLFEGPQPLNSADGVRKYLVQQSTPASEGQSPGRRRGEI